MMPKDSLSYAQYRLQISRVTSGDERLTPSPRTAALFKLLCYALRHPEHSGRWIPVIALLLTKGGPSHESC
jgi:hypothetical protein